MNLLTLLQPQVVRVEPEPKKRGRWQRVRKSKQERDARDEALTEEIQKKLAAWDRKQAAEQDELLAKSSVLPNGVTVVSGQEGQTR